MALRRTVLGEYSTHEVTIVLDPSSLAGNSYSLREGGGEGRGGRRERREKVGEGEGRRREKGGGGRREEEGEGRRREGGDLIVQ